MAWSPWAVALLIVYPAIQIPLVLYMARWFELDGDAPLPTPTRTFWNGEGASGDPVEDVPYFSDLVGVCSHCGTENDPTYTYCRACVSRL